MTPTLRSAAALALAAFALQLAGCASVTMPAPTASPEVVEKVRAARIGSGAVGNFVLAPGKPADIDRTLGGLRGSSMSPAGGSFARQLKDELVASLKAAGLYDERSSRVIEGQLTDSKVDAGMSVGTGRLAARFTVMRGGQKVFDKEIAAESTWPSSFVGAIALPEAINQYGALYKKLVGQLVEDPEFRAAMAP